MCRLISIVGLCLLVYTLSAQEPLFHQHDLDDASSSASFHTILQDRQGMIWIGTDKGIARYDGTIWVDIPVVSKDTTCIIRSLFEDQTSRIWIGTASGDIFYLDPSRKLHPFEIEEGNPRKPVVAITEDLNHNIWFATYGEGAYVYTGSRLFNIGTDDGLQGQDIYTMTRTTAGEVWLGTDNGISICSFTNETKHIRTLTLKDGLPDQIITALKADASGNVWIGTFEFGVAYYDASTGRISIPFEKRDLGEITSFTLFDETEIWIGTRSSGVWRYAPGFTFVKRVEGLYPLRQSRVSDLLADVEGNIWVIYEDGMLLSAFRPFESLQVTTPDVQTIFCDAACVVWLGTKEGLFRLEEHPKSGTLTVRILPDLPLNITDIIEDPFHHLWIGTIDQGLYVYDPQTNKVRHFGSILDQGGYTIMSMALTRSRIWLATLAGVVSYPLTEDILASSGPPQFKLLDDPWQSNLHFVFQVFVDSKDRVWFATDGNGVYSIDGVEVKHYGGRDSLEIKTVYSICEDHQGHLWFNTASLGLVEYDGKQYRPLSVKDGLSSFNIASINTASTGDILITHSKGIDILEPERRHLMYYKSEIDIHDFEPGLNASALSVKGDVFTCGRNVIYKYYGTRHKMSIHPRTQILDVSVFDQSIDFATTRRFAYDQNYMSITYVGLWYTSPSDVTYLYKLEDYDLQWKVSRDRVVSYSNLPPGDYTFLVKASENQFFLDEPVATYSFTISKPFWKKTWFIVLVSLASVASLYFWVKYRERRSGRQAMLKKDMIESQLSALKAQINPHFLFNSFNTLITIIDENTMHPEVAIEYVEKLSDFYRSILQYREQESITLEEEWELVQNYVYLLEKRYGNNIRLHMDPPPREIYILPMTLQMLVENAVKHNVISDAFPLDLYITVDADQYVGVRNNVQPKARPEPSTQFGLHSIIRRYQLMTNQKVIVEQNSTSFTVRIPFLKKSAT